MEVAAPMDEILTLVTRTQDTDELGDPVITTAEREVFCKVRSVGMREFYQAQATGLKPEIVFELSDYLEYENETHVIYNGETYRVLRSYRKGLTIELTCYKEVDPPVRSSEESTV